MAAGQFELFQLRCFVAVAEELNFRRAAQLLNMTQPPLSRQIKLLEHAIGFQLLDRTSRQVWLTPAGESFYDSATDILQRAEHAVLKARQAKRGEVGSIGIGFVPSAAIEFIPRIVTAVTQALPGVTLNPVEMMSYEIVEAQATGKLDLGLTRMERQRPEIGRARAVSEKFILAVPRSHPLATADTPTLADLDGTPYVGYSTERGGFLRETLQAMFVSQGISPRLVQDCSQTHTLLAMVNQGIGVALVPASSQILTMPGLVFRDIELPPHVRSELYLIYRATRSTPLQDQVRDLILNVLSDYNS